MTEEMMSTKQVAQYWEFTRSRSMPDQIEEDSFDSVTGKWIFPRKLIDA